MAGGHGAPGKYLGWWGSLGSPPQKGVTSYALSSNRQKPFAGAAHNAVFNTWRRFKNQVLYFAPPLVAVYFILDWAEKRNEYLNSKAGRAEYADAPE